MPQSSNIKNAKVLSVGLDGYDVALTMSSLHARIEVLTEGYFVACSDWEQLMRGKKRWSGVIRSFYSEAVTEALPLMIEAFDNDQNLSLTFSPRGGGAGTWLWTAEIGLTEMPFEFETGQAGPILVASPFRGDGALERSTVL